MVKPEDSLSQSPGSKPVFRQLTLQGLFAKKLKVDTESAHFGGATRIEKTKDKKQELQEALQSLRAEVVRRVNCCIFLYLFPRGWTQQNTELQLRN